MAKMKWLKESAELMIDPVPKKKSSVKSYLQSLVRVSVELPSPSHHPKTDEIHSCASVDSNQPEISHKESSHSLHASSQMSLHYDKIFRRLSSRNSDGIASLSSKSSEHNLQEDINSIPLRTNLLTPSFVSPVLCRFPGETSTPRQTRKTDPDQSFHNGVVQLFPSGTLILNYESPLGNQNDSRKLSQSYSCRKVLCSKYQSDPHQRGIQFPSPNKSESDSDEISQVALQLRIFSVTSEPESSTRKVTPITLPTHKLNKRKVLFSTDDCTEIILSVTLPFIVLTHLQDLPESYGCKIISLCSEHCGSSS